MLILKVGFDLRSEGGYKLGSLTDSTCHVQQVIEALTKVASSGRIQSSALLPGTPNLLLSSDLYGAYRSRVTASGGP